MAEQNTTSKQERFPLFSAIILHYHNGKYLYQTIDSVLRQDYPNMELIICDDATGEAFSPEKVLDYINLHKSGNIKNVVVHANDVNLGTVRNIEVARSLSMGEFELAIAGDDIWHDSHVFSVFAEKFRELGEDAECIASQVEMCDQTLEIVEEEFVKPEIIDLIMEQKWEELYEIEISTCVLPAAGMAYRRSLLKRQGELSDSYRLVEDYSLHLRLLQDKTRIFWLDIKSVKHRTGGVSHGGSNKVSLTFLYYMRDLANSFLLEVYPNSDRFSNEAFERSFHMFIWNSNVFAENYWRFFRQLKTDQERSEYKEAIGTLAQKEFLRIYQQRMSRAKKSKNPKAAVKVETQRYRRICAILDCQPGASGTKPNAEVAVRRFYHRLWHTVYRIGKRSGLIDHAKYNRSWISIVRNITRIAMFTSLYLLLEQYGMQFYILKAAVLIFGCMEVIVVSMKIVYSIVEGAMGYKR